MKRLQNQTDQKHSTISLMNTEGKNQKKIKKIKKNHKANPANQIQCYAKKIIHHTRVGFTTGKQGWFYIRKSIKHGCPVIPLLNI